jgi:hypothetical protein
MRKSVALAMTAVTTAGLAALLPTSAGAADCSVATTTNCTTTVTGVVGGTGLVGVRTLGPVTGVTLAGASSLSGVLTVPVAEVAAVGTTPWSVTASSSDLTSGGNTISATNLTVADTGLPTGVGCLSVALNQCTVNGGGATPRALDAAKTLFTVTGEQSTVAYTGVYTYTGAMNLAVPNGTPAGTYTGTMTLTLVQ